MQPAGGSTTFSGVIQNGAGQTALTLNGPGTQVLTGSNTYSGLTTISGGTLQFGSGGTTGSINNTSGLVTGADGILAFNRSDNVVFTCADQRQRRPATDGPRRVELRRAGNTYTGPTIISGGTLQD